MNRRAFLTRMAWLAAGAAGSLAAACAAPSVSAPSTSAPTAAPPAATAPTGASAQAAPPTSAPAAAATSAPASSAATVAPAVANAPSGTLTVVQGADITTTDPFQIQAIRGMHTSIYDQLLVRDASFKIAPWLATSWDNPDDHTWVFHLRQGVKLPQRRAVQCRERVVVVPAVRRARREKHLRQHAQPRRTGRRAGRLHGQGDHPGPFPGVAGEPCVRRLHGASAGYADAGRRFLQEPDRHRSVQICVLVAGGKDGGRSGRQPLRRRSADQDHRLATSDGRHDARRRAAHGAGRPDYQHVAGPDLASSTDSRVCPSSSFRARASWCSS